MCARRFLIVTMLLALLISWPQVGAAAQESPADRPLDLAAMALAPDDVPTGFFDDYSEWWVPAAAFADLVLGGGAMPPGLERVYQSFYIDPTTAETIHCYLFEFASPDEAAAGAGVVDGALRPPLPEGDTVGPTHLPGPALGDEPRTLTVVTYDTWAAGGPRADVVAATYRRDRLIVGISIERYADPPADATPSAAVATPGAPDPAQEQLAVTLAGTLDDRITEVLASHAPAGVDLALPDLVLPLDQLAGPDTPVFGGYKSGIDLLRCGICGEENALLPFADAARGGFVRGASLGPLVGGEPQPPFVAVAVSALATPRDALAVLEAIRQAPNDRPTPYPTPRGARTPAADPAIPGADAAVAFHAALDGEDANASIDSAGVDVVVGRWLVTVDVQGGLSADEAMTTAIDLATQQAACLASSAPCSSVTRPASLGDAGAAR